VKYIKKFENITEYKIGDYVCLNVCLKNITFQGIAKIIKKIDFNCQAEFIETTKKMNKIWFDVNEIERMATLEEIEYFEFTKI
jgi:pectate lyase